MAIKITVSDTVGIKVKGSINDASGIPQPFDFSLICERLDADQIQAKLAGDGTIIDFLVDVTRHWTSVKDADEKPMPFSEAALRTLCKIPGVASIAFKTYLQEAGAKEKN